MDIEKEMQQFQEAQRIPNRPDLTERLRFKAQIECRNVLREILEVVKANRLGAPKVDFLETMERAIKLGHVVADRHSYGAAVDTAEAGETPAHHPVPEPKAIEHDVVHGQALIIGRTLGSVMGDVVVDSMGTYYDDVRWYRFKLADPHPHEIVQLAIDRLPSFLLPAHHPAPEPGLSPAAIEAMANLQGENRALREELTRADRDTAKMERDRNATRADLIVANDALEELRKVRETLIEQRDEARARTLSFPGVVKRLAKLAKVARRTAQEYSPPNQADENAFKMFVGYLNRSHMHELANLHHDDEA